MGLKDISVNKTEWLNHLARSECVTVLLLFICSGCVNEKIIASISETGGPDSGTDSESESSNDGDTGSVTDSDTEFDTDTATGSDSEFDTETDTETSTSDCNKGTWEESVTISDEEQLAQLAGYTTLSNHLTIESSTLRSLRGLECLTTIQGTLDVSNNPLLVRLTGLENLRSVEQSVIVQINDSLVDLDALKGIERIGGHLYIDYNSALIKIADTAWNLTSVGGQMRIRGNHSLENLDAFSHLSYAGIAVIVRDNDGLLNILGLSLLNHIGDGSELTSGFEVSKNDNLRSLPQFEKLRQVDGRVILSANDVLTTFNGLESLTEITQDLLIDDNQSLENLAGFASLTDLPGKLQVTDNPSLPTCYAEELRDRLLLSDPSPDEIVIDGNDDSGTCD